MGRYSKNTSNYVLRKKHRDVNGGTIIERDWGTLGEKHVIAKGKKKIYADSNFLFTDSTIPGKKSRIKTDSWSDGYTSANLSGDVNDDVNGIKLNDSDNLSDYAYYGSATELIRTSIENIINWFPGAIYSTNNGIRRVSSDGSYYFIHSIENDGENNYLVNYISASVVGTPCDCITFDSDEKECILFGEDYVKPSDKCDNEIGIFLINNPFNIDLIKQQGSFTEYDNPMRNLPTSWKQYQINGKNVTSYNVWSQLLNKCIDDYSIVCDITIDTECDSDIHIYGIKVGNSIMWAVNRKNFLMTPHNTIIEEYFKNLDGFEKLLLNRKTNPQYTSNLLFPVITDNGFYFEHRQYVWPSYGYCIEVSGLIYEEFITHLYQLGAAYDSLYSDNLWQRMTHESIKNFDTTHHREYEDGDADDLIVGGTRMDNVIHIMGRVFDDIKRYVDGIKLTNDISLDTENGLPNARLSDKAQLNGWEVFSTKLSDNENISMTIDSVGSKRWYPNINPNHITQNDVDNEFMKRLSLLSKPIFRTKGTKHSIEMVFGLFGIGDNDYTISERYYSVTPKKASDIYPFYKRNTGIITNTQDYVIVSNFDTNKPVKTLSDYVIANNYDLTNTPNNICFEERTYDKNGNIIMSSYLYYNKDVSMTVAEFCEYLNRDKSIGKIYDLDPFSGIPITSIKINNDDYIVPYFYQGVQYDGDVYFENNGGWGKYLQPNSDIHGNDVSNYDYLETYPYAKTVNNVSELLKENMSTIGDCYVYYVVDTTDIIDYSTTLPQSLSHYFYLMNRYEPQNISSWRMVPIDLGLNEQDYNTYCNQKDVDGEYIYPLLRGVTYDLYKLVMYHNTLECDMTGNNPHTGRGGYDLGLKYKQYCERPYKFSIDRHLFSTNEISTLASLFHFDIIEHVGNKHMNRLNSDDLSDKYYLPSKVVRIENKIDSDLYREYFNKIILKYIQQVIPSTTILVLDNYKVETEDSIKKCHVNVTTNNSTYGVAKFTTGEGGTEQDVDSGCEVTMLAVQTSDRQFVGWKVDGQIVSNEITYTAIVYCNTTYTAVFKEKMYRLNVYLNDGRWGTTTGTGDYAENSVVTITAYPCIGYKFLRWSNGDTNNILDITLVEDTNITAVFEKMAIGEYAITVKSSDTTQGNAVGGGVFVNGTQIKIQAIPFDGYEFVRWNDGNTDISRFVYVSENKEYTAYFDVKSAIEYDVVVETNSLLWGSVSGSGTYKEGSEITITATPNESDGYGFLQWNDGDTNSTRNIIISNNATYLAIFEETKYNLTIKKPIGGKINGIHGKYGQGTIVTLSYTIGPNVTFSGWKIDGTPVDNNSNVLYVTMDADHTVEAIVKIKEENN